MDPTYERLAQRFADPPTAYGPMIFWIWNGELDGETIQAQIADIAAKGCGGFFIHPMGEQFRLNDFVQGMSPPYLSDEYFEAVGLAVEAARARGLYAWLYDEGGWPSGTAQGHVLAGHPQHAAKVLKPQITPVASDQWLPCPESAVAAFAILADGPPQVLTVSDGGVRAPRGAASVVFFVETPVEPRVDLLSPPAVRRFIEVTHERYAHYVGEHFGTTIPGIFTDEPAVTGKLGTTEIPWTGQLLAEFQTRRGFDLAPLLPTLFEESAIGDGVHQTYEPHVIAQIRCEFSDLWTDLYHDAYWQQINEWCEQHNLMHTGHVGGEDALIGHASHGFGHFFKTAGSLHAPGVDVIWRQLHWDKDNFGFPQFAASAAHQRPGQGGAPDETSPFDNLVISETNAVYGFGLTYEQMRWLVDYQCLRGINMIAPMAILYDTSRGRLFGTQSHIGPGNPQWQLYGAFAGYVASLCAVLRSGVALADVAVYYPIETLWPDPDSGAAHRAWQTLREVARTLDEQQMGFDFIDAQTITTSPVADGVLETRGQFYGSIIVPETSTLPLKAINKLRELYDAGGRVAFVGAIPTVCSDYNVDPQFAEITDQLSAESVTMDAEGEGSRSGDTREGLDESARWDGIASAFMGPQGTDRFAPEVAADQAVLIVPEDEIGRLARLLSIRHGHYSIRPGGIIPNLRLSVRSIGPIEVAFLMNEGLTPLEFELEIVADHPALLERWDPADGTRHLLAGHANVSEVTRVPLELRPGESVLLALSPCESPEVAEEPPSSRRARPQMVNIAYFDAPLAAAVVAEYRVADGDVHVVAPADQSRALPAQLAPWEDLGLLDFSGEVAYEFSFAVAEEYLEDGVILDLGEVCYSARVTINDQEIPPLLWPPYTANISHYLRAHENRMTVTVINTLANQMCSPPVLVEVEDRGWYNSYYKRAVPMMAESRRSGLIGPVRIQLRA